MSQHCRYALLVCAGCRLATELAVLPLHLVALCRETLVTGGMTRRLTSLPVLCLSRSLFSLPCSLAQLLCPPSLNLSIPSRFGAVQLVLWLGQNVRRRNYSDPAPAHKAFPMSYMPQEADNSNRTENALSIRAQGGDQSRSQCKGGQGHVRFRYCGHGRCGGCRGSSRSRS